MKKWWFVALTGSFFAGSILSGTSIFAVPDDKGNPFDNLQKQIDDIINGNTSIEGESKIMFLGTAKPGINNSVRYGCDGFGSGGEPLTACSRNTPTDGKITNLTGSSINEGELASPGIGSSFELMIVVNGIETDLSCEIANDETTCKNTFDSVQVFAGDLIDLKLISKGDPNFVTVAGSALLEP